ncbi:glycosyltransferase family 9 protein [Ferruginibacter sp. SUN002]|uniref:glycosyltransferase family 9 protein n=1 Tax=Ferruginibacter sp. SUN002 TaxID=2937789 RepID=UPI003D36BBC8
MQKILIIQTAFIGDVVLATAVVEKIKAYLPDAKIDFLLRKGNENLLNNNPHINEVLIWVKKENKIKNLFSIIKKIRKTKYDKVINLQRFFATGLITALSGATETIGFDKNPLSFFFSKKIKHIISTSVPYKHEVERNNDLIKDFTDVSINKPKLYPSEKDFEKTRQYTDHLYISITPSSVWFTKQYPIEKWIEFINAVPQNYRIYLLGGPDNKKECEAIREQCLNKNVITLAGELNFLQSAALMKSAIMNYVNDSAPLHFASGMNAPVTAVFCSTLPAFGFTPLSDRSFVIETKETLACRPCGLHGKKECPLKHFKCGFGIETNQLLATLSA